MAVAIGQLSAKRYRGYTIIKAAVRKPAIAFPALLQRLWWHTKAYSVVAGTLLLLGSSLVVLRLHSFYRDGFKRARLSGSSHTSVNAPYD